MSQNILIADSGSTKTSWVAISYQGEVLATARTQGLNPFFTDTPQIIDTLKNDLLPHLPTHTFSSIYFYGAGCTPEKSPIIREALQEVFQAQQVGVHSDMLGAARALCQDKPGIACILGTGANSCSYDGQEMGMNVSPLGFIIGDEGSGAVLGKLFLGAVLKNQMPEGLKEKFLEQHHTTPAEIIDHVYRKPNPNRYLATFSPFIAQHLDIAEVYTLVEEAFRLFIVRNVKQYPNHATDPVHFVGSVAHFYRKPLESACQQEHITLGRILQEPLEGLIEYHTNQH